MQFIPFVPIMAIKTPSFLAIPSWAVPGAARMFVLPVFELSFESIIKRIADGFGAVSPDVMMYASLQRVKRCWSFYFASSVEYLISRAEVSLFRTKLAVHQDIHAQNCRKHHGNGRVILLIGRPMVSTSPDIRCVSLLSAYSAFSARLWLEDKMPETCCKIPS